LSTIFSLLILIRRRKEEEEEEEEEPMGNIIGNTLLKNFSSSLSVSVFVRLTISSSSSSSSLKATIEWILFTKLRRNRDLSVMAAGHLKKLAVGESEAYTRREVKKEKMELVETEPMQLLAALVVRSVSQSGFELLANSSLEMLLLI
jgi:hypothetical protein